MNLPNKLTMLRIILIPVFLVLVLVESIPLHYLWALLVYLIACFTDTLDGHIARSRGPVSYTHLDVYKRQGAHNLDLKNSFAHFSS